jgi:hypothetical protein
MNPEPCFQPGPGDSTDANWMEPCLLVAKSSPPRGGHRKMPIGFKQKLFITIHLEIPTCYAGKKAAEMDTA